MGPLSIDGSVVMTDRTRLQEINFAVEQIGDDRHVVILDQTTRVSPGWLEAMVECLDPTMIHSIAGRTISDRSVGLIGPCTDQTVNDVQRMELSGGDAAMGLSAYAAARMDHFTPGVVTAADTLDGFCLMVSRDTIEAVTKSGDLLNVSCGSWVWSDLCLRAAKHGHECAVSEQVYVGRAVSIPLGSQVVGSVEDRLDFYARHPAKSSHLVVGVIPVRLHSWQDLQLVRASISRLGTLVDGLALVLCTNPLDIMNDPARRGRMSSIDEKLFKGCNGTARNIAAAFTSWAESVLEKTHGNGISKDLVWCEIFEGAATEREHRNRGISMAKDMGGDAILVLDDDEMVEYAFTKEQLQKTLSHPNPLVRCFDVGVLYAWDAPTLVREDSPWGHGGSYRGGGHAPRLYRLSGTSDAEIQGGDRPGAVRDHGVAAHRVAAMRLRRFRYSRPADRTKLTDSGEGMRLSQWQMENRIGMHMLVYSEENPEDVARWLDEVHALVDHAVLVWTDEWSEKDKAWTLDADQLDGDEWPGSGPSRALALVAHMHGVGWVHEPLDDNLAQARNAGIAALAERGGLSWAWFMDPDEWFGSSMEDCIAMRNMACSSRWGWLMQVANYRSDHAAPTISDSVRISRIDDDIPVRMNGRVHESFSDSIKDLQSKGIHPRLVYAPFVVQHRGMAFDAERMSTKLDKYDNLLRMQLEDEPLDPGSWVSLGWQYFNDGHVPEGLECYRRAVSCAGTSYLPYKEMAYYHLRQARELMDNCNDRLVEGHQFYELGTHMGKWLNRYAPPAPVIERPEGWEAGEPEPLPDWSEPDSSS